MEKKKRNHVVISFTGRAWTTFLVKLLTKLGFDTGFNENNMFVDDNANAGLELDIRNEAAPYIVKHPQFSSYVDEVLDRNDIILEHVFLPMRDLNAAAQSRWTVVKDSRTEMDLIRRLFKKPSKIACGFLYTDKKREQ